MPEATAAFAFHDLPDPLIAAFVDRVHKLETDSWHSLVGEPIPLLRLPTHMFSKYVGSSIMLRLHAVTLISMSTMGVTDPHCLHVYVQMYRNLKRLGWPVEARSAVAKSLFSLRARDSVMAKPYDERVELLIPFESLSKHTFS